MQCWLLFYVLSELETEIDWPLHGKVSPLTITPSVFLIFYWQFARGSSDALLSDKEVQPIITNNVSAYDFSTRCACVEVKLLLFILKPCTDYRKQYSHIYENVVKNIAFFDKLSGFEIRMFSPFCSIYFLLLLYAFKKIRFLQNLWYRRLFHRRALPSMPISSHEASSSCLRRESRKEPKPGG